MASIILFGYFGPETVLPVTSIIATIAGLAMMFGRHTLRLIVSCGRLILTGKFRKSADATNTYRGPHHAQVGSRDHVATGEAEPYDQSAA